MYLWKEICVDTWKMCSFEEVKERDEVARGEAIRKKALQNKMKAWDHPLFSSLSSSFLITDVHWARAPTSLPWLHDQMKLLLEWGSCWETISLCSQSYHSRRVVAVTGNTTAVCGTTFHLCRLQTPSLSFILFVTLFLLVLVKKTLIFFEYIFVKSVCPDGENNTSCKHSLVYSV